MRTFHNLRFRTYSHATEDTHKVEFALRHVSGARNLELERLKGHHGNPITKITAFLERRQDIEEFLRRLGDSGTVQGVLATLNRSVDDEGSLHIRLSKQAAFEGRIELATDDDAISVRAKVRAYPSNKKEAIRILMESLGEV